MLLDDSDKLGYQEQMAKRYSLEPLIESFARFEASRGLDVLEIGVALSAAHQRFAQSFAGLTVIDLTDRAAFLTGNDDHLSRWYDDTLVALVLGARF